MASEMSFQQFWTTVAERWRTFAIVGVVAAVASSLLSGPHFIKPRYLSAAIMYPVNLQSFSVETRTDQLLQYFGSNNIRDSLIRKFDLTTAYDVDTASQGGYFRLYNEFNDRVEVSKTRYESVQVEVEDESPVRARDMVQEMIRQVNLLARRLQREKSNELLVIAERAMGNELHKLDSVEMRLSVLRKEHGLLAYESQTEELTKGYVRMLTRSGATASQRAEVKQMIDELQQKGGEFRNLTVLSDMFRSNYDRLLTEYELAVNDVTKELTYTNLVVYPEVSDKKVYPVRWLIVVLATLAALFLTFVLMLFKRSV